MSKLALTIAKYRYLTTVNAKRVLKLLRHKELKHLFSVSRHLYQANKYHKEGHQDSCQSHRDDHMLLAVSQRLYQHSAQHKNVQRMHHRRPNGLHFGRDPSLHGEIPAQTLLPNGGALQVQRALHKRDHQGPLATLDQLKFVACLYPKAYNSVHAVLQPALGIA